MSDTRTPDEIERDLEKNREGLRESLEAVQRTFSLDNIFESVSEGVRRHGGDWTQSINRNAQANPLALAVTGIGLGWLIFGRGPSAMQMNSAARDRLGDDGTRDRDYGEGADASIGTRGPVPDHDGPNWLRDEDRGPSAGQRARAGFRNTSRDAGRRLRAGGDATGRAAGRVRDRSESMFRQLREGTDSLGEDARERVISARERAVEARESAGRNLSRGADRAGDFFEEHPLVAGALAFAVGAAIAGALPRTRQEDEMFGADSDALIDDAEAIFHEESEKAKRVAGAALDEARNVGDEAKKDAEAVAGAARGEADNRSSDDRRPGDEVADRVERAAERVAGAAERKADEEDLGNPRSS